MYLRLQKLVCGPFYITRENLHLRYWPVLTIGYVGLLPTKTIEYASLWVKQVSVPVSCSSISFCFGITEILSWTCFRQLWLSIITCIMLYLVICSTTFNSSWFLSIQSWTVKNNIIWNMWPATGLQTGCYLSVLAIYISYSLFTHLQPAPCQFYR